MPRVCSPLSVVTSTEGKKQLVVNLRYLYQGMPLNTYADLRIAMSILRPGDFLFKYLATTIFRFFNHTGHIKGSPRVPKVM